MLFSGDFAPAMAVTSEGVPGRAFREFEIPEIGSEPQPESGTDRHQDHMTIAGRKRRHAQTADEIG
jgi:hypothetical protein